MSMDFGLKHIGEVIRQSKNIHIFSLYANRGSQLDQHFFVASEISTGHHKHNKLSVLFTSNKRLKTRNLNFALKNNKITNLRSEI